MEVETEQSPGASERARYGKTASYLASASASSNSTALNSALREYLKRLTPLP